MPIKRYQPIGVNIDVNPLQVPENQWTEAGNMLAQPGRMVRAKGYAPIFGSPLFPPYFLMATPQLGRPWWLYAGTDSVATIDPTFSHNDITPAGFPSPVEPNGWTGGNLNGIACFNSFTTGPYYWFDGIAPNEATPLPGQRANTRYGILRPFKYHLIGMNVSDASGSFDDAVHWSDGADPGQVPATWVPAADNEAGDNILADESGAIIDGLSLRDSFFIYKQDSVYEMQYVGGATVFEFRKVFGTTGVLTRNCVARVKGTHVVLGNGDIYQHDGQNIRSLVDGKLRRTFFSTISSENFDNSFVVYNEPIEEVWFCVPTTGNSVPNLALVWNVSTDEFGYRIIPEADFAASGVIGEQQGLETWDAETGTWAERSGNWVEQTITETEDSIVICDATAEEFYLNDVGNTANGLAYRSTVGKLSMLLGNPETEKAVRRIWPHIRAPEGTNFTMELFNQRDPQADFEQTQVIQFTHPTRDGVACNTNARYLGMRLYTDDSVDWNIAGMDIDFRERGRF